MSRPARRSDISVSLFPFLAVLVCAMGALIFLLLVVTRMVRSQAVAKAAEIVRPAVSDVPEVDPATLLPAAPWTAPEPRSAPAYAPDPEPAAIAAVPPSRLPEEIPARPIVVESPPDPDAEWRLRAAMLRNARDAEEAKVRAARAAVDAVAGRLDATRSMRESRAVALDAAMRTVDEVRQSAEELDQERLRLVDEGKHLVEIARRTKERRASAPSRYAFVPYDGESGTRRRPILVDCTARGLRFVPEDILLQEADLVGFSIGQNPLLAGATALSHYWTARSRVDASLRGEVELEPYVLLVVRPDGAAAFYAAQKLLRDMSTPFGYELVQADWQLDLPPADPQAKAACRAAIEALLREREAVASAVRGGGGATGTRPGSGGSGATGTPGARGSAAGPDDGIGPLVLGGAPSGSPSPARGGFDPRSFLAPRSDGPTGTGSAGMPSPFDKENGAVESGNGPGRASLRPQSEFASLPSGTSGSPGTPGGPRFPGSSDSGSNTSVGGSARETPTSRTSSSSSSGSSPSGSGTNTTGRSDPPDAPPDTSGVERIRPSTGAGNARGTHSPSARPQDASPFPTFGPSGGSAASGADDEHRLAVGKARGAGPDTSRWGRVAQRNTIGYEKSVTIEVHADRLIVDDEYRIRLDGTPASAVVEDLLTAIHHVSSSWETPPRGFHWQPSARFRIHPGGNVHYERLHGPLKRAGIGARVEFVLETTPAAGKAE